MSSETERVRILLVDDERPFLKALGEFVGSPERIIQLAFDGKEALQCLEGEDPPHIVVTDLVMPGPDGMEILRRSLELDPCRPVILMTGYGSIDTALKAMREGAFDYKAKPLVLEEVGFSIRRAEMYLALVRERDALREKVKCLEREVERLRSKMPGRSEDGSVQGDLPVLRRAHSPLDASSFYQYWDLSNVELKEDLIVLEHLLAQGAITEEQYERLKERLSAEVARKTGS